MLPMKIDLDSKNAQHLQAMASASGLGYLA